MVIVDCELMPGHWNNYYGNFWQFWINSSENLENDMLNTAVEKLGSLLMQEKLITIIICLLNVHFNR